MVPKLPTQNIYQFLRSLAWRIRRDRMRFGSELRRKAEQIFVIPTCAWAVLSAVIQAGVMGVCGAGRHGTTPPWKGSTKDKEV